MKIVVADASSLILLGKASVLRRACSRYEIYIPRSVEKETASSVLIQRWPDARQIHDLIGLDVLKVRIITGQRMRMPVRLGPGESDAIRLFLQLKAHVLLTDDGKAIKASRMLKIPFTISPNIVLDLYERKDLTVKEATQALEKLRLFGRYSPDIIAEILLKLRWEKDDA